MAVQAGLCLAWLETPEDKFCRVMAQMQSFMVETLLNRQGSGYFFGNSSNFAKLMVMEKCRKCFLTWRLSLQKCMSVKFYVGNKTDMEDNEQFCVTGILNTTGNREDSGKPAAHPCCLTGTCTKLTQRKLQRATILPFVVAKYTHWTHH